MKLSTRTEFAAATAWEHARVTAARQAHPDPIDLTGSNPTALPAWRHDVQLLRLLGDSAGSEYRPEPLGLLAAREAVSAYYAARHVEVTADRVWITASTSEAYAQLMTITADPGQRWWLPRPGYPLLETLGALHGVALQPYDLVLEGGHWRIDVAALAEALSRDASSTAIVVIAPGNPTGAYLHGDDLAALVALAQRHGLWLIVDEVFADWELARPPGGSVRHVGGPLPCPTVVLSGLSKVAALPQLKLAWGAYHGPCSVWEALQPRLEHVADAYLSVATPVQLALGQLLAQTEGWQVERRDHLRHNLATLTQVLRDTPADVLPTQGGWTALVRLPQIGDRDDLAWTIELAQEAGVWVLPGYLFDLPSPPRVAVSLLPGAQVFAAGVTRLRQWVIDVAERS